MEELPAPIHQNIEFIADGRKYYGERIEHWVPTQFGTEVGCGKDADIPIEITSGVSETQQEELKNHLEFSIGVKDVSLFKAGLDESLSTQITWSANKKAVITVPLRAPKCGRALQIVHRRIFTYKIYTIKRRIIRGDIVIDLPEFREETETYIARSYWEIDDPACPCGDDAPKGTPVRTKLRFDQKLTAMVDGFVDALGGLSFYLGRKEYRFRDVSAFSNGQHVKLDQVPEFFLTLAGLTGAEQTRVELSVLSEGDPIRVETFIQQPSPEVEPS